MAAAVNNDPWWMHVAGALGGVVVASGAIVYGLLATAYDKFYTELGLTPADVGLQYGKALGGAAALAISVLALTVALGSFLSWVLNALAAGAGIPSSFAGIAITIAVVELVAVSVLAITFLVDPITGILLTLLVGLTVYGPKWLARVHHTNARTLYATLLAIAIAWVTLSAAMDRLANYWADEVKEGRWVQPPETAGLTFFAVRAMPVSSLSSISQTPGDNRLVRERRDHELMFLALADGTMVLYDATWQQPLLLPADTFRAPFVNCETDQPHPKRKRCDRE